MLVRIRGPCIGKPSLASEGNLPTNDGLLGCELEAVHACGNPIPKSPYSPISTTKPNSLGLIPSSPTPSVQGKCR